MNALQKGELYMRKVNIPNQQDYMNTNVKISVDYILVNLRRFGIK